jgi:heme/copper-type cytochrome/quinol oxidase subunit 2
MDEETRLAWGVVAELILVGLVTLLLTIATIWIVWYVAKAVDPDEVRHLRFFLTFIVVIIPFVILIYFGSAIIIYDDITAPPWPTVLPLKKPPLDYLAAAVIYIGLTAWLWLRWRKP